MAKLMQICIVSSLALTAAANCLGRCEIAMNAGDVGSCKFSDCSASRGPTHCSWGSCYCNEGYCRYPATTVHVQSRTCRQRAGDDTCHATRVCYNAGLTTSSCSGGLCFCKFGYKYDCAKKTCYWSPGALELAGTNMTTVELDELRKEGDIETMYNVLTAAAWACAAFVLAISGAVALRWRLRSSKIEASDRDYVTIEE